MKDEIVTLKPKRLLSCVRPMKIPAAVVKAAMTECEQNCGSKAPQEAERGAREGESMEGRVFHRGQE